jgi:signal peptidase I
MAAFTAFVLAAFVSYAGAWYMGMYEGNFALLLFTATVVTGLYWLAEHFYFLPQRWRRPMLWPVKPKSGGKNVTN